MDEDQKWIERCKRGDRQAFEPLVKKYYEQVVRIAYGVVRRQEDAVDVAQSAFLKAFQNIGRFSGRSRFSTWLYRIVVNQAIDWKRRMSRREAVSLDEPSEDGREQQVDQNVLPQPTEDPRQTAFGQEVEAYVDQALETLSEEHRQVFMLREVQGLSYEEIAEIVDCPVGTVMSRLHNARKMLREKLSEWL